MKLLRYFSGYHLDERFLRGANCCAQSPLKIATEEWPPYVYEQDGKVVGYSALIF